MSAEEAKMAEESNEQLSPENAECALCSTVLSGKPTVECKQCNKIVCENCSRGKLRLAEKMEVVCDECLNEATGSPSSLSDSAEDRKDKEEDDTVSDMFHEPAQGEVSDWAMEILTDTQVKKEERFSETHRNDYRQSLQVRMSRLSMMAPPVIPEEMPDTEGAQKEDLFGGPQISKLPSEELEAEGLQPIRQPLMQIHWEGALKKRSEWLHQWEASYWVTEGNQLYRYASKREAERCHLKPSASQALVRPPFFGTVILVTDSTSATNYHRFRITLDNGKIYHMQSDSEMDKQLWMHTLAAGVESKPVSPLGSAPFVVDLAVGLNDFYSVYRYILLSLTDILDFPTAGGKADKVGNNMPMPRSSVDPPVSYPISRFLSLLSHNAFITSNYLSTVPFAGSFRGPLGAGDFLTKLTNTVGFEHLEIEGMSMDGKFAVVSGSETMEDRKSGRKITQKWVHKLRFGNNGRVNRWEILADVVASSVIFQQSGPATVLELPRMQGAVRQSVFGGGTISVHVGPVTGIKTDSQEAYVHLLFRQQSSGQLSQAKTMGVSAEEQQSLFRSSIAFLSKKSRQGVTFSFNQDVKLTFSNISQDDDTKLQVVLRSVDRDLTLGEVYVNLAKLMEPESKQRSVKSIYNLSREDKPYCGKINLKVDVELPQIEGSSTRIRESEAFTSGSSSKSSAASPSMLDSIASFRRHKTGVHDGKAATEAPQGASKNGGESPIDLQLLSVGADKFVIDSRFDLVKPIGKGSYGVVIAASDKQGGGTFAIKKITDFLKHKKLCSLTIREIKLMRILGQHPNIMGITELQMPQSLRRFEDLYIVQPLMETDLCKVIHSKMKLTDEHISYFVYQLLCGINFMDSANVIHRDLKPSNILINSDCEVKICDLGLARSLDDIEEGLSEYVVTRWYRAPELLLANMYTSAVDVWSVGCIFGEMLGRKVLFPGRSYVDQLRLIIEVIGVPADFDFVDNPKAKRYAAREFMSMAKSRPIPWDQLYPDANPEALSLLSKLLTFDPNKRITAKEALKHPYLSQWRSPDREVQTVPIRERTNYDHRELSKRQFQALLYREVLKYHNRQEPKEVTECLQTVDPPVQLEAVKEVINGGGADAAENGDGARAKEGNGSSKQGTSGQQSSSQPVQS